MKIAAVLFRNRRKEKEEIRCSFREGLSDSYEQNKDIKKKIREKILPGVEKLKNYRENWEETFLLERER